MEVVIISIIWARAISMMVVGEEHSEPTVADLLGTLRRFLDEHKAAEATQPQNRNNFVARGKICKFSAIFFECNFPICISATSMCRWQDGNSIGIHM